MKRFLLAVLLAAGACNLFYDPTAVPDPEAGEADAATADAEVDSGPGAADAGGDTGVHEPDGGLDAGADAGNVPDGGGDGSVPGPDAGADGGTGGAGAPCGSSSDCLDSTYFNCLGGHCCNAASCWCTNSGDIRGQYAAASLATCETGACQSSGTSCGPYACDEAGKQCLTSCTRDHDCLAGSVCLTSGKCGTAAPIGVNCARDPQCASGVCTSLSAGSRVCNECRTDADCPSSAPVCNAGRCEQCTTAPNPNCSGNGWGAGSCTFNGDCTCAPAPAISPLGCGPRAPYCNNTTISKCQCSQTEPECRHGQVCDSKTATCKVALGFACLSDLDCGSGFGSSAVCDTALFECR